jgi:uncharacterized damage-inducible protein DinB
MTDASHPPAAENPLLETWAIHDRINRYLLDAVPPGALDALSASQGRTVGGQFAHIHNVRLMWLRSAAPELLDGLAKIEKADSTATTTLRDGLSGSGAAIATLLGNALAGHGRIRGFKPHAVAFLGYLVAHESHHRGQIVLSLKQSGHPLDRKVLFGLWEWGSR